MRSHLGLTPPLLALVACSTSFVNLRDTSQARLDTGESLHSGDSPSESDPPDSPDTPPSHETSETVPGLDCSHLAVFMIDTAGAGIIADVKTDASMVVIRCHDGTLEDLDSAPRDWYGDIGIEIHGSSSSGYPKYNYRFETRDESGEDTEVGLLDLPSGSDWVLHGPYCDKTLIRNALAYEIAREVAASPESGRWEPRTDFLELYVDGSYQGVYLLVERIQRDNDRIDIPPVAATSAEGDISGGYVVKVDQHRNEGWNTVRGTPIDYHYPRYDDITSEQQRALSGYFDSFEATLARGDWADPITGYPAHIDVDAWVDHYVVNELAHNIDAYRLSAYLYKTPTDEGGLIYAGPVWDFDRAFANVYYCYCNEVEGFTIDDLTRCGYGYEYPFWWSQLLSDPAFANRLRCRWEELRGSLLSDAGLESMIVELTLRVRDTEPRDNARWNTIGEWIDPNDYVGETWEQEIQYLQDWTLARAAWLDAFMPGTCEG